MFTAIAVWMGIGSVIAGTKLLHRKVSEAMNRKPEPTPQVREVFVPRPPEPKKPEPPPKPSKEELLRREDEQLYRDSQIIEKSQMSQVAKEQAMLYRRNIYEQRVKDIIDGTIEQ